MTDRRCGKSRHNLTVFLSSSSLLSESNAIPSLETRGTQAYILHLQTVITWDQAFTDLDSAFVAYKPGADRNEFVARLDKSLKEFEDARSKAVTMAEKWSEMVDHPSDLGVLYWINVFMIDGTEQTAKLIENIDNFHHGRDYVEPADFGKIFVPWPPLATVPWQAAEDVAPE